MATTPWVLAIVTAMNEYQMRVLTAARAVLSGHGLGLLAHCDGPLERGVRSSLLVSLLREAPPLGVLGMNSLDAYEGEELQRLLKSVGLPAVHIGVKLPGVDCVWADNASGMRDLLGHLLDERGSRQPLLVRGTPHHPDSIEREQVYREELARRGLSVDEHLVVTGDFAQDTAYAEVSRVLAGEVAFDAVVAMNDPSAWGAVAALDEHGLRIPEDVAVCGFDNDTTAAYWPGLTSVDQNLQAQGAIAAQLLVDRLAGRDAAEHVLVPCRVVSRGSTAPRGSAAVTDVDVAIGMARAEQRQLTTQDALLSLSQALNLCWTVDDVVDTVAAHLPRFGVARCLLALHQRVDTTDDADDGPVRVTTDRARLVLDYRAGRRHHTPDEVFPAHLLVPEAQRAELASGLLVVQPLGVLDRPLGYLLFEPGDSLSHLGPLLRTELSRALDAVLTTEELRQHAARLENTVANRTRELHLANDELRRSAMRDGLTELANRTAFDEHLAEQWRIHLRDGIELAVIMVDVDFFKAYNDHHGHLRGDEALRRVADALRAAIRNSQDLACRYGGEEFTIVLARTDATGAEAMAERFRAALAAMTLPHPLSSVSDVLTASIGIAAGTPSPGGRPEDLVAAADAAMYRAKALGRDRVVVDEPATTVPSSSLVS